MLSTSAPVVVRRIQMQARIGRLEVIHGALEHFWSAGEDRQAPPPLSARMQFDLAVAEVAANICEHAAGGGAVTMELELTLYPDHAEALFEDDGEAATLPAHVGLPLDSSESGRGLAIVKRVVDEISYTRAGPHQNVWFLKKDLVS